MQVLLGSAEPPQNNLNIGNAISDTTHHLKRILQYYSKNKLYYQIVLSMMPPTISNGFHNNYKNLWRRKCVRRAIFRNIEGLRVPLSPLILTLFAIPPLGHYATYMGSRYPKN